MQMLTQALPRILNSKVAMRSLLFLCTCLLSSLVTCFAAGDVVDGLVCNPIADPMGARDNFLDLTESELVEHWSHDDATLSLDSKIEDLKSFEVVTYVTIKLVGFEGDGFQSVTLRADAFNSFFDAMKKDVEPVRVIHPEVEGQHNMNINKKGLYDVAWAAPTLNLQINKVVEDHLARDDARGEDGVARANIPVSTVDKIIQEDFEKDPLHYTIYFLNLDPKVSGADKTIWTYHLTKKDDNHAESCPITMWAGKKRYMWIDLNAGPVTYGPHTAGEGLITEFTIPRLSNYPNTKPGHMAFVSDLCALAHTTTNYVINPQLHRVPSRLDRKLAVYLVTVTDHGDDEETEVETDPETGEPKEPEAKNLLDWDRIVAELNTLKIPTQELIFNSYETQFHDCPLCVVAYTLGLKSHTSNILSDGLRTQVHQYIDSEEFHSWLSHFTDKYWGGELEDEETRAIPVFLFNLNQHGILLLDRFHQAMSFDDMVVAVQTKASKAVVDFSCNGTNMAFDTRDATRAVIASMLQTVWGVPATHETWDPILNTTMENYLWSTSHTPFGHFSHSREISFYHKDAAKRNVVYAYLDNTITTMLHLLDHFKQFNKQLDEVLTPDEHIQFIRRWNVFRFKLEKASDAIALHNFPHALYYATSLEHDARALSVIVHDAGQQLKTYVSCFGREKTAWSSILTVLAFFVLVGFAIKNIAKKFTPNTKKTR